eukprot:TRINITY_DN1638_c0_g1_i1.p1 TRINITY_DN1638_c0_g1~~TRINITY_DN1638_c0_g1_i1.p1  ORF type:complete len:433 (+),score=52.93 TRINITY_DN1638_c0_g1_i1:48-1346(+)
MLKLNNIIYYMASIIPMMMMVPLLCNAASYSTPIRHGSFSPSTDSNMKRSATPVQGDYIQFIAEITLSGQPFVVQVDTGSSLLAVSSSSCGNCDPGPNSFLNLDIVTPISCQSKECAADNECNTSGVCAFTVQYGDNSNITGSIVSTLFGMAGLNSTAQVGAITSENPSNFEAPFADGIMGMMLSTDASTATAFSTLVAANDIPNIFSIYLDFTTGGELILGDITEQYGEITYTPLNYVANTPFYQVTISQMFIDDANLGFTENSFCNVIIDTGTTDLLFPQDTYQRIQRYFQSHYCNTEGICGSGNIFLGYGVGSDIRSELPTLKFNIQGDYTISVSPYSYMLVSKSNGRTVYYLGISYLPVTTTSKYCQTVFGYAGMRGSYIVYDGENQRLGFAGNGTVSSDAATTKTWMMSGHFFVLATIFVSILSLSV